MRRSGKSSLTSTNVLIDDELERKPFLPNTISSNHINCESLMILRPARSGICMKKNDTWLSWLFPCLFSKWKKRFLVLLGNYLYRFESEVGDRVKGSPIPIDSCSVTSSTSTSSQTTSNSAEMEAEGAPYFVVTTIRKRYVFIVETSEEAQEWVEAIKLRKFLSIKENMGHAPLNEEVRRMNQLANRLVDKKLILERKEVEEVTGNPVLTSSI